MPSNRRNRGIHRTSQACTRGRAGAGAGNCPCFACTVGRTKHAFDALAEALRADPGLVSRVAIFGRREEAGGYSVPVSRTSVPLLGVRRSRVFITSNPQKFWLASAVIGPVIYEQGERAYCDEFRVDHTNVPVAACTCGYYAIADPKNISNHCSYSGLDVWVSMSGRVVEHSEGFRAEKFHCLHATSKCAHCSGPAKALAFNLATAVHYARQKATLGLLSGTAVCGAHLRRVNDADRVISVVEVLAKLGIPYEENRYWEIS